MLRTFFVTALLLGVLLGTMIAFGMRIQAQIVPAITGAPIGGATITVTTALEESNNDGKCSLREAVQAAASDAAVDGCAAGSGRDTILLPASHFVLATGTLTLTGALTLQGSLSGTTILDGDSTHRVLYVAADATVTLSHLDIRNGQGVLWGEAFYPVPGEGGGIANYGVLTIAHSAIHDNRAGMAYIDMHGSTGASGGGIYNGGVLTITNSTISRNAAGNAVPGWITHGGETGCGVDGEGGGIANFGTLTLDNVTIADNQPGTGNRPRPTTCFSPYAGRFGGLYVAEAATARLKNSILAGNLVGDCGGEVVALGYNLIQTQDNCTITGEYTHWVAYLEPLAQEGGSTLTHALNARSPAIDTGSCTDSQGRTVTVDQRGAPRPQGDTCDIGAFESPYTSTFVVYETGLPIIDFNPSPCATINPACNVTNHPWDDDFPSISPNGQKIAFMRTGPEDAGRQIHVVNVDGSGAKRLTDYYEFPAISWSPDSRQIAFNGGAMGWWDIYVVSVEDATLHNLTHSPESSEYAPSWSPDGTQILYNIAGRTDQEGSDLYLMNANGSNKRRVADGGSHIAAPWSPDGSSFAYVDTPDWGGYVHIADSNGNKIVDIEAVHFYANPSWSPDGSRIAYRCHGEPQWPYLGNICVANRDGSSQIDFGVNVLNTPLLWSPDGRKIAYQCQTASICVINSDGSQQRPVLADEYGYSVNLWSPDSSSLLFDRYNAQKARDEIGLVKVDSGEQKLLAILPQLGYWGPPVLSPDGSRLIYGAKATDNAEIYVLGLEEAAGAAN